MLRIGPDAKFELPVTVFALKSISLGVTQIRLLSGELFEKDHPLLEFELRVLVSKSLEVLHDRGQASLVNVVPNVEELFFPAGEIPLQLVQECEESEALASETRSLSRWVAQILSGSCVPIPNRRKRSKRVRLPQNDHGIPEILPEPNELRGDFGRDTLVSPNSEKQLSGLCE